jgi:hypothetical protein
MITSLTTVQILQQKIGEILLWMITSLTTLQILQQKIG